jgi:thymidylate synthase
MQDKEYVRAVDYVLDNGCPKGDRTGTGTRSVTGLQLRFDLRQGFPLLTLKHVPFRVVAVELQWFLQGYDNVQWLQDRNVHIWDDDAKKSKERGFTDYPPGYLGPIYGQQWRNWNGHIDQIAELERQLSEDDTSRRMIVSAWNVSALPEMVLPPCHVMFQVLANDNYLDLVVTMRSGDMGLGIPFNMASYALLLSLLAKIHQYKARHLIINIGDAHIYSNHLEPLQELRQRVPYTSPTLHIPDTITSLEDFCKLDHKQFILWVRDYIFHPKLIMPLST